MTPNQPTMPINVVALVKDDEQYAFIYDDNSLPQLLQTLGRYAADPELSFEWKDAARLSCAARGKEYKSEKTMSDQKPNKWPYIDSCVGLIALAMCYCVTVGGCWYAIAKR